MSRVPLDDPSVLAALDLAERAVAGFHTLHLGPLDHNVFATVDNLRTAALMLEDYFQQTQRAGS